MQNVVGNNPLKWERTGIIVEVLPYKQYKVKLDGSGRISLRNRRHLRRFTPFYTKVKRPTQPVVPEPAHTHLADKSSLGNQDPKETPRENLDLDVPDPGVTFPDIPGDISPKANESKNESPIPQAVTFPKAKEQEIGSPLVTREKPKEIKIPLALRRLF